MRLSFLHFSPQIPNTLFHQETIFRSVAGSYLLPRTYFFSSHKEQVLAEMRDPVVFSRLTIAGTSARATATIFFTSFRIHKATYTKQRLRFIGIKGKKVKEESKITYRLQRSKPPQLCPFYPPDCVRATLLIHLVESEHDTCYRRFFL